VKIVIGTVATGQVRLRVIIIIIIIIIIYLLQLGYYSVAVVILHVNKT